MSNHPIIKALQEDSEKLAYREWNKYSATRVNSPVDKNEFQHFVNGCKSGHEAATARLLSIVEKAVEMAEFISSFPSMYGMGPEDAQSVTKKAREFLTTLANASGEDK